MKLTTWYKLSLLLPVIVLSLLFVISINLPDNEHHPLHYLLLLKAGSVYGLILYVPFMILVVLRWRLRKYRTEKIANQSLFLHIKSIPNIYCVYAAAAVPAWLLYIQFGGGYKVQAEFELWATVILSAALFVFVLLYGLKSCLALATPHTPENA